MVLVCVQIILMNDLLESIDLLVYVIVWVAVVFEINCASNAGRKLVIVQGTAEHYYCFLPALYECN